MQNRDKKIRVALVTYAMHCGGVETFLLNLGKYLLLKGYAVDIVVTEEKGIWFSMIEKSGCRSVFIKGSRIWKNYLPFGDIVFSLKVGLTLKRQGYDIIFLNFTKYAQTSIRLFNERSKIVTILHSIHPDIFTIGLANQKEWDACVCVSEKVYAVAMEKQPGNSIFLIHCGIATPNISGVVLDRPLPESCLKILFVGRLQNSQKGIFLIPRIIQELIRRNIGDFSITIVGDGTDKVELMRLIREHSLEKFVTFLGMLPNDQVMILMLQHHLLLMPSYYEGFPIVLLESLSAGCVPVVTLLPMITDITIENNKNGFLISMDDVEGFADAISFFKDNPGKWLDFSYQAIQTIQHKYTIDSMGHKYVGLIEKLIDDPIMRHHRRRIGMPLDYSLIGIHPIPLFVRLGFIWLHAP